MALFTDGPISSARDLQDYDGSVLSVASSEGIDLTAKVRLAQQDLANELILFLRRRARFRDSPLNVERAWGLTDVVVTDALRQWHVYRTLAMVYRDAFSNQLNDRYKSKWDEYEQLGKDSSQTYFHLGVGVVAEPIPRAPLPVLISVAGSGAGNTYFVAATWVSAEGQEGAPSDFAELTTAAGETLNATLSGAGENVVGWNVYVGISPSSATRQNDGPLATGGSWTVTAGLNTGNSLPAGQKPACFIVDHNLMERG
jgi:hypothetical protein